MSSVWNSQIQIYPRWQCCGEICYIATDQLTLSVIHTDLFFPELERVWLILNTIQANSRPYNALAVASRVSSACNTVCRRHIDSPRVVVNVVMSDCSNSTGSRSSSLMTVDTTGLFCTTASSEPFFTRKWISPICKIATRMRNIAFTSWDE